MKDETESILIVDDDRGIREVLEEYLLEKGYRVDTAFDGREAIEKLKIKNYDIMVADMKMPGMNGLELLKTVRQIDPDTVVIMMTGYASLDSAIQAIREGAYDYITKPFQLEEIYIAIRNACEKIFLRRQHKVIIDELRRANDEVQINKKSENVGESGSNKQGREVVSELDKLASLLDRGMLTRNEFDLLKRRYIEV